MSVLVHKCGAAALKSRSGIVIPGSHSHRRGNDGGGVVHVANLSAADERLVREATGYFGAVKPGMEKARDDAIAAAVAFLKRNQYRNFRSNDEFASRVWPEMAGAFGDTITSDDVANEVDGAVDAVYRYYRLSDRSAWKPKNAPAKFAFGPKDVRTLQFGQKIDKFWLGKFISSDESRAQGLAIIKKQYLEEGEGLFGRGSEAAINRFRAAVGKSVDELSNYQAQRIIDSSVVRLRGMGHVRQMAEVEVDELELINVGGACGECRPLDNQNKPLVLIAPVAPMTAEVDRIVGMSVDEYESYIKSRSAVRGRMGTAGMVRSGGIQLPIHPNCRCRWAAVVI